jgi:hypothetical protein
VSETGSQSAWGPCEKCEGTVLQSIPKNVINVH